MPIASTWLEFLAARDSETTNTTKRLTEIFVTANHATSFAAGTEWRNWLFKPDALSTSLPTAVPGTDVPNVRQFVEGDSVGPPHVATPVGPALTGDLKPEELDHIDDWPNPQKEEVRAALETAIKRGCAVEFHWAVHNGDYETTEIEDPGAAKSPPHPPIKITFHSPWKFVKMHVNAANDIDEVKVNVNELPDENMTGPP